jgi:hypothetical protein
MDLSRAEEPAEAVDRGGREARLGARLASCRLSVALQQRLEEPVHSVTALQVESGLYSVIALAIETVRGPRSFS